MNGAEGEPKALQGKTRCTIATIRWIGGARKISKVISYVFAGTWAANEILTVTVGVKQWTYTLASAVIDTEMALFVTGYNALSATDYPELTEMTAAYTAGTNTLTLTADTAGIPFTCTISSDSAAGTIDAVAAPTTSPGVVSTQNSGPQSLRSLKNYDGGALPVNGDTLIFDWSADEILYDLDVLSGVTLTVLRIHSTFEGKLGLPKDNTNSETYPEYRTDYFTVGATTVYIGEGEGAGSNRIKINFGTVQTTVNVLQSGTGEQEGTATAKAVLLRGTHASNVLNVTKGSVGVAAFGGELSTILTLNQSFETDIAADSDVYLGPGVTFGTGSKTGGVLEINSAVSTAITQDAGMTTINGTGAVAQLTIRGGYVAYNSMGTLGGAPVISGDGLLDFDQDKRAKTVTNPIDCYGAGRVRDSSKVVATFIVDYNEMNVGDWGRNVRITRGAVA